MSERGPIDELLAPPIDESRIAATWNRIAGARKRKRKPDVRWMFAAAAGVAAIATVAVIAWPKPHRDQPLASRDPWVSAVPGAVWTHDVDLDDNSRIGLRTGSRLQVLANEGTRFSTLLETGTAHFDVQPGGPRRWEIETALASVEVVGTAFTVSLDEHRLAVDVERGVVVVHGERVPGRVVRLTAGQHIVVGATVTAAVTPPPPPPAPPAPSPVIAPHAPQPVVHRIEVQPHPAPAPQPSIASPHRFAVLRGPAKPDLSIADVVADADRHIASGDAAGAALLLERVRPRDSSGLVPFTLGRLYLDVLGKPDLAAAAFGDVIARGNPRSLVEDAHARRVEALVHAGDHERAATALADYERAYPHGRRIAALRALVGAP